MRVIVTGGAGFIGSHLVDRLVRDRVGEPDDPLFALPRLWDAYRRGATA